ncbi:MAG: FprA family A-type flavoprotein [Eubacteriaceae bacterium]|jgi:flavorubredoxin
MKNTEIGNGIYWIGVQDYTTYLFEGMWPIDQEGVNYNAYVVMDEKIALIDTVKSIKSDEYLENIKSVIGDRKPDYLIVNHMEPDHSSSIAEVLEEYPDIQIVGNKKTFPMIRNFYDIDTNFMEIENGQELDLGGRKLQFFFTPMVHWPESMVTFDQKTGTLFSMDVFGSYKATVGSIFDDENDYKSFEFPTYRYYATIVGKVTEMAQRSLAALAPLDIKTVCPSHGLVWRKNLDYLLDMWKRLAYAETVPGVVIAYGTMYGNTLESAQIIADELKKDGVKNVIMYDVSKTNISYILADIWKYQGLILGSPAYYGQIYPPMENLLYKLTGNKVRNHVCGFFTEFSWSGGAERYFDEFAKKTNALMAADIVKVQGAPQKGDIVALKTLARAVAMEINKE